MKNIYAIAHKELRSYFVSPIAYVVVGFFSILFGYFFVASLSIMVRFSTQAGMYGMGGGPPVSDGQSLRRGEKVRHDRTTAHISSERS